MRLRTTTSGNCTTYSTYLRFCRWLSLYLDRKVDKVADRAWNKEHGPRG